MKTVPAELRLVDGAENIIVRPYRPSYKSPVICREWNPGSPSAREVVNDLVGADGVADHTFFTGARTVVLDLAIFGTDSETPYNYLERLLALTHPTRRPYLYVTRDNGEEWRIQLRGNEFSISYGRMAAAMLEVQLSFSAPAGMFESPQRHAQASAAATPGTGQIWPETWPEDYGSGGTSVVPFEVNVDSSVPVEPTIRIYGPATGPVAMALDTGEVFAFEPTYTIFPNHYVEVDMRAGTVLLDGDPASSMFNNVDWTQSTFWRLPPGVTQIGFAGDGGMLYVYWRDRRLTA